MAIALAAAQGPVDQVGDDERFRIHSALAITGLLREVAAAREIVTVQFGGSDDFVVSAVLAVDYEQQLVVLDYGADEAAMERLLRTTRLRISTQLHGVHILFQADAAAAVTYDDGLAFCVRLPAAVLRMQRRDAYRLKVPLGRPLVCEIPPAQPGSGHVAVRVRDISVAGLGLVDYPKDLAVSTGMVWTGCHIVLPDLGPLLADVEVMHASEGDVRRCGCRFRALALPMANLIQRYITRVERDQHAVR